MSHNDYGRQGGFYSGTDVPVARDFQRWNALQQQSIDGTSGGTYAPSTPIVIGGSGLHLTTSSSQITGGIVTRRNGRMQLGNNDFPTFQTTRSRSFVVSLIDCTQSFLSKSDIEPNGSGVLINGYGLVQGIQTFPIPKRFLHNGATLTSIELRFRVGQGHLAVPSTLPNITGFYISDSGNGTLYSGTTKFLATPADGPAYFANGLPQSIIMPVDQNNVIDTTARNYTVAIVDEASTNSIQPSGNIYHSLKLTYTTISDMKFE